MDGCFISGTSGRQLGLIPEQLWLCLWFLSFRLKKSPWQMETFSFKIKQLVFFKRRLLRLPGRKMALMKENINWLQQKGRREAERERPLLHADGFHNVAQRVGRDTPGAAEAEMSAGVGWAWSAPCFSRGKLAIPTALWPDYMLLLGIMLCPIVENSTQTRQVSLVKSKAHSSLSSSRLSTSTWPVWLPLCTGIHGVYQLSLSRGSNPRCVNKPRW